MKKVELNIQGLWDNYENFNMQVIGIPDGKERKQNKFLKKKIVTKNFFQLLIKRPQIQAE